MDGESPVMAGPAMVSVLQKKGCVCAGSAEGERLGVLATLARGT